MTKAQIAALAIAGIAGEFNNRDPHRRAVAVAQGLDLTPQEGAELLDMLTEAWENFPGMAREIEIYEVIIPAVRAYVASI